MAITRDQWRTRLLGAGIPEEVVDATLEGMKDQDFLRMKDMEPEQILAELAAIGVNVPKSEDGGEVVATAEAEIVAKDVEGDEDVVDLTDAFEALKKDLLDAISASPIGGGSLELELPEMDAIHTTIADLRTEVTLIKDMLTQLLKAEEERLQELVKDLSPASKARLVVHQKPAISADEAAKMKDQVAQWFGAQASDQGGVFKPIIRDASGNEYNTLGDMILRTQAE